MAEKQGGGGGLGVYIIKLKTYSFKRLCVGTSQCDVLVVKSVAVIMKIEISVQLQLPVSENIVPKPSFLALVGRDVLRTRNVWNFGL